MKSLTFGLFCIACATSAQASTVIENGTTYTISFSSMLPSSYAPTNVVDISGPVTTAPPSSGYVAGTTYLGLTQTYDNIARSPFENTGNSSGPFDAVTYGGAKPSYATFGTPVVSEARSQFVSQVQPSSTFGTGSGSFSFIYGSPDSYNTLSFLDSGMNVFASFTGSQLTDPNAPSGAGFQTTTISGDFSYQYVRFETTANSFEFAAVSAVPLPASLPMFGGALLALAGFSYGLNRWVAPKSKAISAA